MDLFKRLVGGDKEPGQATEAGANAVEPTHLTGEEFDQKVMNSEVPVVVDFWAEWCGPCHRIAPYVTKMAQEYEGRALIAKVNADEYPEILMRYGIMGIPTLLYFKGGQEADRVVGLNGYDTLKGKLDRLLG